MKIETAISRRQMLSVAAGGIVMAGGVHSRPMKACSMSTIPGAPTSGRST
jgi:hypothetical protein